MKPFTQQSSRPTNGSLDFKWLLGIIALSVLTRIAASLYIGNSISALPGVTDQISYHTLAHSLLEGKGFTFPVNWWPATQAGEPTAHWSFLYTLFITAVYALFGEFPLAVRLAQSIIAGILQPLLLYKIGKELFGSTAGLVAAGLDALYFYFIYYSATLMTESFFITAILAVLYFAFRLTDQNRIYTGAGRWSCALGLGVSMGAAVLFRQVFLLFLPFLFLWIVYARRKSDLKKCILQLVVAGSLVMAMIVPFTLYNYARFGRFVLLNTNAGYAFFWGNNPIYGTKFEAILTPQTANYLELLPIELKGLNEAELDTALLQRGFQFVLNAPVRYVLLSISRIPIYFTFWPTADSSLVSNLSRVGSFGISLPFMLYGAALAIFNSGKKRMRLDSPQFLLLLFGIIYSLIHILTWTLVRYRLPIDAVFLLFAGFGINELATRSLFKRSAPVTIP